MSIYLKLWKYCNFRPNIHSSASGQRRRKSMKIKDGATSSYPIITVIYYYFPLWWKSWLEFRWGEGGGDDHRKADKCRDSIEWKGIWRFWKLDRPRAGNPRINFSLAGRSSIVYFDGFSAAFLLLVQCRRARIWFQKPGRALHGNQEKYHPRSYTR